MMKSVKYQENEEGEGNFEFVFGFRTTSQLHLVPVSIFKIKSSQ